MELIVDKLSHNPVLLAIVVVVALLVVFAFMKRLVKIAIFLLALLVLYFAYLVISGKEVPTNPKELKESVEQQIEDFRGALKEKATEAVEKKVDELIEGKPKEE